MVSPERHWHWRALLRAPLIVLSCLANLYLSACRACSTSSRGLPSAATTESATQAPGLAVVLVGGRKDSETYVRNKKKACAEVGIVDFGASLPEDATEEDVLQVLFPQSYYNRIITRRSDDCRDGPQLPP